MKVFIGWSGDLSHKVAVALRDWLPSVIQSVKPYVSSEDIAKGARWSIEIAQELEATSFGVICVTRENSTSAWINFEAGALSREIEKSHVAPFLFNVRQSEIQGPLGQFQSVANDKDEFRKLMTSIDERQEPDQRLGPVALDKAFERWWPDLKDAFDKIQKEPVAAIVKPNQEAMLAELLDISRAQQRQIYEVAVQTDGAIREAVTRQEARYESLANTMNTISRSVEALHLLQLKPDPLQNLYLRVKAPQPPPAFTAQMVESIAKAMRAIAPPHSLTDEAVVKAIRAIVQPPGSLMDEATARAIDAFASQKSSTANPADAGAAGDKPPDPKPDK